MVGGISMDQVTVDVTDVPEARVGDEACLVCEQLPAIEVARQLGADFSEIVLTALSRRVARVYVRDTAPCAA